jgi:hypothetical protein
MEVLTLRTSLRVAREKQLAGITMTLQTAQWRDDDNDDNDDNK